MRIEDYHFGAITVEGKKYTSDLIIWPDRVFSWWRKTGHSVVMADIDKILAARPQAVIFGTGATGLMVVSREVEEYLRSKGIEVIILKTKEACEKHNELCSKVHPLVTAVHLTC